MRVVTGKVMLPLTTIPALLVTGAALLVLVAGVAGAASANQPGSLLYPVRRSALRLQLALTDDPAKRAVLETLLAQPPADQASNDSLPSPDEMAGVPATPGLDPALNVQGSASDGDGEPVGGLLSPVVNSTTAIEVDRGSDDDRGSSGEAGDDRGNTAAGGLTSGIGGGNVISSGQSSSAGTGSLISGADSTSSGSDRSGDDSSHSGVGNADDHSGSSTDDSSGSGSGGDDSSGSGSVSEDDRSTDDNSDSSVSSGGGNSGSGGGGDDSLDDDSHDDGD